MLIPLFPRISRSSFRQRRLGAPSVSLQEEKISRGSFPCLEQKFLLVFKYEFGAFIILLAKFDWK